MSSFDETPRSVSEPREGAASEPASLTKSGNWPGYAKLPDHDRRMMAARRAAGWYLGDPAWAEQLVGYYLNPADAIPTLDEQMGPE